MQMPMQAPQAEPTLSASDQLLCMLIYLGYNTDEVSVFLGISHPSVNSARYRLRRKLNLDKQTDLDMFIASLQEKAPQPKPTPAPEKPTPAPEKPKASPEKPQTKPEKPQTDPSP